MAIPIIFSHRTDSEYVYYSLRQAKVSNPDSDVFLFGTSSNIKNISGNTKHVMINDYSKGASDFAKVYKHVTINPYDYNLFCFQRWFILRDYMRQHNISECWGFDTDVMLFTDLKNPEYQNFSYEFSWTTITTLKDLEEFCTMQLEYFSHQKLFEELKIYTKEIGLYNQKTGFIISDMVTMRLYFEKQLKRKKLNGLFSNSYFDHNIQKNFPGIEMLNNKKKVYLIDGNFYCKKTDSNQFIKLNSLHFQSPKNKKFMKYFYSPNTKNKGEYFFDYNTCQWIETRV